MKFEDEVRFLARQRLAVMMPDGKLHPISRKLRHPRGIIPVRAVEKDGLPKELLDMIRQSRAEYRKLRSSRNAK